MGEVTGAQQPSAGIRLRRQAPYEQETRMPKLPEPQLADADDVVRLDPVSTRMAVGASHNLRSA
ncbi:hypothetical protein [Nonomuraea sp. NPDC049784]|uniref:hypothetical protein n=1 Tax=Nonomuraea sp. NPDC049784 TaxID=3154361 RepID=UPI0033F05453